MFILCLRSGLITLCLNTLGNTFETQILLQQHVFILKAFILINNQLLKTANSKDINTDYYITNSISASRYHGSVAQSRIKVLLIQFFPVALSVILLPLYAKCNFASVYTANQERAKKVRPPSSPKNISGIGIFPPKVSSFGIILRHPFW